MGPPVQEEPRTEAGPQRGLEKLGVQVGGGLLGLQTQRGTGLRRAGWTSDNSQLLAPSLGFGWQKDQWVVGVADNLVMCHLPSQVKNPQLCMAKVGGEQLNSASNFSDLKTTLITMFPSVR